MRKEGNEPIKHSDSPYCLVDTQFKDDEGLVRCKFYTTLYGEYKNLNTTGWMKSKAIIFHKVYAREAANWRNPDREWNAWH